MCPPGIIGVFARVLESVTPSSWRPSLPAAHAPHCQQLCTLSSPPPYSSGNPPTETPERPFRAPPDSHTAGPRDAPARQLRRLHPRILISSQPSPVRQGALTVLSPRVSSSSSSRPVPETRAHSPSNQLATHAPWSLGVPSANATSRSIQTSAHSGNSPCLSARL